MSNEETNTPLTGDEPETSLELSPTTNQAVMALASATSELARALVEINYTPTDWVDLAEPDIDAAHLNKIEQGILQATTAINSAFSAINSINSNLQRYETTSDANQITKNGTYRFSAAGTALNVPFNNHAGIIYDIGTTKRMQICRAYYLWEADNSLFYRVYGDSWSEWQRIALKSDLGDMRGIKVAYSFDAAYNINTPPAAFILQAHTSHTTGDLPAGLGGTVFIILQSNPGNDSHNGQFAFGFATDKIAFRKKNGSTTWDEWKYVTFS